MRPRLATILRSTKDLFRIAGSGDVLGRIGTFLMRKSPRATVWTAGITSSGYLTNTLGLLPGEITATQALVAPFLVGGTFLSLGVSLRYIPSTLWRRLTIVAEANDLNLMEDYRKSQLREHLHRLWDKVFSYEAALRYPPHRRQAEETRLTQAKKRMSDEIEGWDGAILTALGLRHGDDIQGLVNAMMAAQPYNASLEACREGFLVSSTYALHNTLPQATQTERIGFGLGLFEDFCDGAYFDRSDQKLLLQYQGNSTLGDCKKQCHFNAVDALRELPLKILGRLWFALVTRKVGMGVGRAVRLFNERYQTDRFNAQVFLWPGEESAPWVLAYEGAAEEVRRQRTSLLRRVLGRTYADAERVLNGMLLPTFELATLLRMRFDYEYCAGTLDHEDEFGHLVRDNCLNDWRTYRYPVEWVQNREDWVKRATEDMARFTDFLTERGPDTRLQDDLVLRAIRILFHTDTDSIKTRFRQDRRKLDQTMIIDRTVTQLPILNHRLMTLRLHHQLTQIQIQGYRALVKSLAYEIAKETTSPEQKEIPMSSPVKIYTYKRCGTCRKALKYLVDKGIAFEDIPIRETPPAKSELKTMLKHLDGRKNLLFNTSGGDYRELKIKDKLPQMSDQEAIDLLNANGNLVKRPFLLTAQGGLVGFKQDQWDAFF